ncbi:hypothetical protein M758_5G085400 [Ceratodon purpureus]|nr:hypothetical protein M758_5G085400 [Ceratodon purpureus]
MPTLPHPTPMPLSAPFHSIPLQPWAMKSPTSLPPSFLPIPTIIAYNATPAAHDTATAALLTDMHSHDWESSIAHHEDCISLHSWHWRGGEWLSRVRHALSRAMQCNGNQCSDSEAWVDGVRIYYSFEVAMGWRCVF